MGVGKGKRNDKVENQEGNQTEKDAMWTHEETQHASKSLTF